MRRAKGRMVMWIRSKQLHNIMTLFAFLLALTGMYACLNSKTWIHGDNVVGGIVCPMAGTLALHVNKGTEISDVGAGLRGGCTAPSRRGPRTAHTHTHMHRPFFVCRGRPICRVLHSLEDSSLLRIVQCMHRSLSALISRSSSTGTLCCQLCITISTD